MMKERQTRSGMFCMEAGEGAPVLLVHGAFSDYRVWEPQIASLAASHRVLSVSLRGYHPSQADIDGATARGQVEDLVDLVGELSEPVVLVGHSRGGRIALDVAARCGARIGRLVLVEPGGVMEPDFLASPPPQPAGPDIRLEVRRLIAAGDTATALEAYIDAGHGAGRWKRLPAWFRDMAVANAHTIAMMIDDSSVPLSRRLARDVTAPTLLVCGARSPRIFHATIAALRGELKTSILVTIDNGDHFLTLDAAREFNRVLAGFLGAAA